MRIEPAHINQILRASDGRMVEISADIGGVVADLQRMDPHLGVRFAEAGNPPYWHVYWADERRARLVTSVQAYQNASGVWEGLDQRLVKHMQEIDPHGRKGYDYAGELEKQNREASRRRSEKFSEQIDGAKAAWALRKDFDVKDRVFIPRDIA